jgi:MFS transporter, FHS family, L-fucose permease
MALPSSWILKKIGFKNGMMVGLMVMAVGALIFVPAAISRVYLVFLVSLFIVGTGLAILQTASNPYVTIIGPRESAASRISIMGICNKLAGAIAPLILAYFILQDSDSFVENLKTMHFAQRTAALDELASRVIGPYIGMAVILLILAFGVKFSPLPEIEAEAEEETDSEIVEAKTSIFQFPHLWLGVISLFFYVGVEVIAGDTIITYANSLGIPLSEAKMFTSYTLVAMIVGYLAGISMIPKIISQSTALKYSAVLGVILSVIAIFTNGYTSVFFVALLGLANAIVWPAIWPLAIHDLGKFIKTGSALLIMAIAGGAILPLAWGGLADVFKSHPPYAYIICIPCYLVILYFAIWGHKVGLKKKV